MNPFELPPIGSPVDVPQNVASGPRRGRMVWVAVLTAGLIGGSIAGISQLAGANQPDLGTQATDEPTDTVPPVDDTVPPVEESEDGSDDGTELPSVADESAAEGDIVLDTGDGDPIVIELGEFDSDTIERLSECIGFSQFDLDLDVELGDWDPDEFALDLDEFFDGLPFDLEDFDAEFGDFGMFDGEGSVTVAGPDGVSVVDLGENGSVTVTKDGDDVTISTDGDATVSELSDLFGDFDTIFERDGSPFGDDRFAEFLETLPAFDELPGIEPIDPEALRSCVDEVLGR